MPIANCRLPIADCPLPIVNYQLKDLTSLEPGYQWAMGNGQSAIGNRQLAIGNRQCTGGEGGIRTHGTVPRTQHFQCCQFNHSCTSPKFLIFDFRLLICARGKLNDCWYKPIKNRKSKVKKC